MMMWSHSLVPLHSSKVQLAKASFAKYSNKEIFHLALPDYIENKLEKVLDENNIHRPLERQSIRLLFGICFIEKRDKYATGKYQIEHNFDVFNLMAETHRKSPLAFESFLVSIVHNFTDVEFVKKALRRVHEFSAKQHDVSDAALVGRTHLPEVFSISKAFEMYEKYSKFLTDFPNAVFFDHEQWPLLAIQSHHVLNNFELAVLHVNDTLAGKRYLLRHDKEKLPLKKENWEVAAIFSKILNLKYKIKSKIFMKSALELHNAYLKEKDPAGYEAVNKLVKEVYGISYPGLEVAVESANEQLRNVMSSIHLFYDDRLTKEDAESIRLISRTKTVPHFKKKLRIKKSIEKIFDVAGHFIIFPDHLIEKLSHDTVYKSESQKLEDIYKHFSYYLEEKFKMPEKISEMIEYKKTVVKAIPGREKNRIDKNTDNPAKNNKGLMLGYRVYLPHARKLPGKNLNDMVNFPTEFQIMSESDFEHNEFSEDAGHEYIKYDINVKDDEILVNVRDDKKKLKIIKLKKGQKASDLFLELYSNIPTQDLQPGYSLWKLNAAGKNIAKDKQIKWDTEIKSGDTIHISSTVLLNQRIPEAVLNAQKIRHMQGLRHITRIFDETHLDATARRKALREYAQPIFKDFEGARLKVAEQINQKPPLAKNNKRNNKRDNKKDKKKKR